MLNRIREILNQEADAIQSIPLNDSVTKAVQLLSLCEGKVFTTGIGKSGYVARKAASTLSTSGTPACFLHPGDALHGDVGVLTDQDVVLAYSNSGKNREVLEVIQFARKLNVRGVIAMCSTRNSPLGMESDICLEIGFITEACPLGLTPTSSATAMMAFSDALALTAMQERGFSREDFALRHHGGYLGSVLKAEKKVGNV